MLVNDGTEKESPVIVSKALDEEISMKIDNNSLNNKLQILANDGIEKDSLEIAPNALDIAMSEDINNISPDYVDIYNKPMLTNEGTVFSKEVTDRRFWP